MLSDDTKSTLQQLPLCKSRATPRDDEWKTRLGEELKSIIKFVEMNKAKDTNWFKLKPQNREGTKYKGTCWYIYEMKRYEFDLEFELPVTYPTTPFEIVLPQLEGKTPKMYRGGKICLSAHFKPLWTRNVPRFGIAHALALGLAPWLAAEIPHLVGTGVVGDQFTDNPGQTSSSSTQSTTAGGASII